MKKINQINQRVIQLSAVVTITALLIPSCATSPDGQQTQAQGAGVGALAGALLGAGLGAVTGMDSSAIGKLAAVGAGVGAVSGFAYGTSIANRKAGWIVAEDNLALAIADAEKKNSEAVAYNRALSSQVASLESQVKSVAADSKQRKSIQNATKQQIDQNKKQLEKLDKDVSDIDFALNDLKTNGKQNESGYKTLQGSKSSLVKQKSVTENTNQKLASIQARVAA